MDCCNNFPNIKITKGNNFSIILPLRSRTYVATKPIDEDIDPLQLENVVVTFGGVEYPAQKTAQGVQIDLPATLAVGTYNILLTAEYLESNIRAAYESAVTIVPWSAQSTAEQYIAGSPIVLRAAYVLSCVLTDAELEALKEEAREKIAEAEQAKADAEAAKAEWEQKAADLEDVAKETSMRAALEYIGTPASGQPSTLFAAIAAVGGFPTDYAKQGTDPTASLTKVQESIDALNIMPSVNYDGYVFPDGFTPYGAAAIYTEKTYLIQVNDTNWVSGSLIYFHNMPALQKINLPNCTASLDNDSLSGLPALTEAILPKVNNINYHRLFRNDGMLVKLDLHNAMGDIAVVDFCSGCTNLRELDLYSHGTIVGSGGFSGCNNLIKFIIGANFNGNKGIGGWNPIYALNPSMTTLIEEGEPFANNLEKFLYNVRTYIAANLPTITNGYSITFTANVKAAILADQATQDAFTNKGWTIA